MKTARTPERTEKLLQEYVRWSHDIGELLEDMRDKFDRENYLEAGVLELLDEFEPGLSRNVK